MECKLLLHLHWPGTSPGTRKTHGEGMIGPLEAPGDHKNTTNQAKVPAKSSGGKIRTVARVVDRREFL